MPLPRWPDSGAVLARRAEALSEVNRVRPADGFFFP